MVVPNKVLRALVIGVVLGGSISCLLLFLLATSQPIPIKKFDSEFAVYTTGRLGPPYYSILHNQGGQQYVSPNHYTIQRQYEQGDWAGSIVRSSYMYYCQMPDSIEPLGVYQLSTPTRLGDTTYYTFGDSCQSANLKVFRFMLTRLGHMLDSYCITMLVQYPKIG